MAPEEEVRQRDIDAAIRSFETYLRTDDAIRQGGYTQPEAIDSFFGDQEALDFARLSHELWSAAGITQTGSAKIVSTEVVEYVGDPLDEADTDHVQRGVCLDFTGVDMLDTAGVNHESEGVPEVKIANFTLQHFPDSDTDSTWKTMTEDYTREACS